MLEVTGGGLRASGRHNGNTSKKDTNNNGQSQQMATWWGKSNDRQTEIADHLRERYQTAETRCSNCWKARKAIAHRLGTTEGKQQLTSGTTVRALFYIKKAHLLCSIPSNLAFIGEIVCAHQRHGTRDPRGTPLHFSRLVCIFSRKTPPPATTFFRIRIIRPIPVNFGAEKFKLICCCDLE